MVFFSSSSSPRTSTVILRVRSPLATAVVTSAMSRTWLVRFDAIRLTLSVSSFHVPETPRTSAWPPSLPSTPTSRATRVTSSANERQLVDHRVDGVLQLEQLAADLDGDLARQVAAWRSRWRPPTMSRTWLVRFDAIWLTLSVSSFQVPRTPSTEAWPPSLPSVPTSRATRVTWSANARQLIDHRVDGVLQLEDLALARRRRSSAAGRPAAMAVATWEMLRTCSVRLSAIELTASVRWRQVPEHAAHVGLAAQLALDADLGGEPRHLVGERRTADRP